ncbi:MAG: endonuclease domain-containing protein [Cytophagales bacterium]|nr:endonuclease domain-containing protein [Cytophagales bacterium]
MRAAQVKGFKFNRQKPIDNYIVDFYCKKLNLVIEVDGESHVHDQASIGDERRQNLLEQMGVSFLRFDDLDVKFIMTFVLGEIYHFIEVWKASNPPSPLDKRDY